MQTAVIDGRGVYLGMFVEGAEIPQGARRLPQITECDLPIGMYAWVASPVDAYGRPNPFGGAFHFRPEAG
jgi:hypothetical protein